MDADNSPINNGRVKEESSDCLSLKSDKSMDRGIDFLISPESSTCRTPVPSCYESMKSDWSMDPPHNFKEGGPSGVKEEISDCPSCLSLKSDKSMDRGINFLISPESSVVTADQVRCFVCSDTLRDPVCIPCGHSYCMSCIDDHWSRPGPAGDYACPRCEKTYPARPELSVNEAMKLLVQAHCAGPACDVCSSETRPAIKTCVTCNASYCENHVRHHYTVPALQKHTLADTMTQVN